MAGLPRVDLAVAVSVGRLELPPQLLDDLLILILILIPILILMIIITIDDLGVEHGARRGHRGRLRRRDYLLFTMNTFPVK